MMELVVSDFLVRKFLAACQTITRNTRSTIITTIFIRSNERSIARTQAEYARLETGTYTPTINILYGWKFWREDCLADC